MSTPGSGDVSTRVNLVIFSSTTCTTKKRHRKNEMHPSLILLFKNLMYTKLLPVLEKKSLVTRGARFCQCYINAQQISSSTFNFSLFTAWHPDLRTSLTGHVKNSMLTKLRLNFRKVLHHPFNLTGPIRLSFLKTKT